MRFSIEADGEAERLVVPADQSDIATMFLSLWFFGWTLAGFSAISRLAQVNVLSDLVWPIGWAVAWCAIALLLAWMLTGREILRFIGDDLEVTREILGRARRRLYAGGEVERISVRVPFRFPGSAFFPSPIDLRGNSGSVHFIYRGRSECLAYGMNKHEANAIADWLRNRLPHAQ
ncbi:MAG: hypothetical protein JNK19_16835 [Tabrizicola sp.]|nr:hypothetical protein [Tabrizicola sp.]